MPVSLTVEPLTAAAFAPFGDVIETSPEARRMVINDGFAERFHALARVDLGDAINAEAGVAFINIFRAKPRSVPLSLSVLERHPLGSQAFMPLDGHAYLVVVAPGDAQPDLTAVRCFAARGDQGVNYARGTWHHPLLSLHEVCNFLVVDRGGPGKNLEELVLPAGTFQIAGLPG